MSCRIAAGVRFVLAAGVLALVGALGLVAPSVAGAHGGEARLDLLEAEAVPGGVELAVRVTYVNDGHGASDATVTAVVVDPDDPDAPGTPVSLPATGEEGVHGGLVSTPRPGTWTIRLTSVEPTASAEVSVDVPAPAPTPTPTPTPNPTSAPGPEAGSAPPPPAPNAGTDPVGAPVAAADGVPTDGDQGGDGGPAVWVWLLGGAAAVVAVGAGVVLVRQGSRPGPID